MILYRTALIYLCGIYLATVLPVQCQLTTTKIHHQHEDTSSTSYSLQHHPKPLSAVLTTKLTANDAATDGQFGKSVALSEDTAIVGAVGDGEDSGSAYVFVVREGTTWTEQQKLVASDATRGNYFGYSVSLSGDTAVVGAYAEGGDYSGSAYVFVREGTTWTEQQKLVASDAASGDSFGISVALSGDTLIIGARQSGLLGKNMGPGSAYVFVRDRKTSTWTEQQKLTASDATSGDDFGKSVALSGDHTAIVGALTDGDGGRQSGSAYVFVREGALWREHQKLTAGDAAAGDRFGSSVALSGDTAIVGAWGDDNYRGSAYVFVRDEMTSTWREQQKLKASDTAEFHMFGYSVALSGDMAIVGALSDEGGPGSGSAFVFLRDGRTLAWVEKQKLMASNAAGDDYFGKSVALCGNTAIVGAEGHGDGGHKSGSAFVATFNIDSGCLRDSNDACSAVDAFIE